MGDFRDYAEQLAPRGGWLSDDASKAWLRAQGGAVSTSLALWREGRRARFASTAPEDALPLIGDNRQIERAPRETPVRYRGRLRRCFEIHEARSTPLAYKEAFKPFYGLNATQYMTVANDYEDSVIPAPPGADPWWSRVTVIIDMTAGPWSTPLWDDGAVWSDDEVWGLFGPTWDEIKFLRRTIRKWKWAGALPLAIVFIFGGAVWGLETVWSDSDVWSDDPADVAVMPMAHVWDFNTEVYGAPPDLWSDDGVWLDVYDFGE